MIEYIPIKEVRYRDFYISYTYTVINGTDKNSEKRNINITIRSRKSNSVIETFLREVYDDYL
jgi:acetolactate synthase regulatory subunit